MVPAEQPPQCFGMSLNSIASADNQHRCVQYAQHPLGFCRKIDVSRRIQQGDFGFSERKNRLFGKDGNTAFPFKGFGIEKGIPMVDPSEFAKVAGCI